MKPVISHSSALEYWRSVRIGERTFIPVDSVQPLLETPPNKGCFDEPAAWWLSSPLHVLVDCENTCRTSREVVSHICRGELPYGAIFGTRKGFYICSPEFTFLQMACVMDLPKLIELGFELCGTYDTYEGNFRTCKPLTTVDKLMTFVKGSKGVKGCNKALRALKYVVNGSASPRETILTMLLSLPYSMGGYGLKTPELNYRIELKGSASRIAGKSYCVCDLYWPREKVAVEYDSDEFHAEADRLTRDTLRRAALESMGISVNTVTNRQMNSRYLFHEIAKMIASDTGKRLRYKESSFRDACYGLRDSLFATNQAF